jgi:hypothetical protein
MTDRKKPGVAFWATVVVVGLPVLYVLSFGPACWWLSKPPPPGYSAIGDTRTAPQFYWPIGWLAMKDPRWSRKIIFWYATRGIDRVMVPCKWDGDSIGQW